MRVTEGGFCSLNVWLDGGETPARQAGRRLGRAHPDGCLCPTFGAVASCPPGTLPQALRSDGGEPASLGL